MTEASNLIVEIGDAKNQLGIKTIDEQRDLKLQAIIDAATIVIEDIAGHILPADFTETYDGGDISIFLRHTPILTVTSIAENRGSDTYTLTAQPVGHGTDDYGYTIEDRTNGRIVRRNLSGTPVPFGIPFTGVGSSMPITYPTVLGRSVGNIQVVYTAGRASVPENLRQATLELIRHVWQWGQQGGRQGWGAGSGPDEQPVTTPSGFLVPRRVVQYCGSSPRMPVLA